MISVVQGAAVGANPSSVGEFQGLPGAATVAPFRGGERAVYLNQTFPLLLALVAPHPNGVTNCYIRQRLCELGFRKAHDVYAFDADGVVLFDNTAADFVQGVINLLDRGLLKCSTWNISRP